MNNQSVVILLEISMADAIEINFSGHRLDLSNMYLFFYVFNN